jgi:hypothetical protein
MKPITGSLYARVRKGQYKMEVVADCIHKIPLELIATKKDDIGFWIDYFTNPYMQYHIDFYHDEAVNIDELLDDLEGYIDGNLIRTAEFRKFLIANLIQVFSDLEVGKLRSYSGVFMIRCRLDVRGSCASNDVVNHDLTIRAIP